ncbi:hypothetical protein [Nocardiopsis sp. CNT312]|uniref:hypothetical protein n=1 Tax=Nocardiopsis sp. CNT312 TaxID=1137268 RepID=UPI00350FEF36
MWDVWSEGEPLTVGVHRDRALSITWTGGSRLVASGSVDGTLRVWDADTPLEELTRAGRRRTFRTLTAEERRAHLLAVGGDEGSGCSYRCQAAWARWCREGGSDLPEKPLHILTVSRRG